MPTADIAFGPINAHRADVTAASRGNGVPAFLSSRSHLTPLLRKVCPTFLDFCIVHDEPAEWVSRVHQSIIVLEQSVKGGLPRDLGLADLA
jgi:hypothetical protein